MTFISNGSYHQGNGTMVTVLAGITMVMDHQGAGITKATA
jgi:hypothetical protein